ncbi:MAG TPA: glycerol-3-phosphate dehydrogenase/oxidase [Acidobacteriaceae bacterium]|nr:glycerol-3-phosphate dehydrogenase/oxidase [Acidobacteriaceae bacterium]
MKREDMLARVRERKEPWDMLVIGGGATGAGVALDAASRGYFVLLLEREDFGKGTSGRSTKLIHGGVRYLQQGKLSLVIEALKERDILLRNAPHLVHELPFLIPSYTFLEKPFYGAGLKLYDLLAGGSGFQKSKLLSQTQALDLQPSIRQKDLRGGVLYYDGQFDDARLLITIVTTAADHGATVLNHAGVVEITKDSAGVVNGAIAVDGETGERLRCEARVVVNATGIFSDEVRRLSDAGAPPMIAPSQGIHLVFDNSFLDGGAAVMVPHTSDGRLMFAIPWHEHTLIGTTDTPIAEPCYEPRPLEQEIQFILETAGRYLRKTPRREDILSSFAGVRPLVKPSGAAARATSRLSREHSISIDSSGLLTISGGKWTTYRRMAEDAVDETIKMGRLKPAPCVTKDLRLHGYDPTPPSAFAAYGSDAAHIRDLAASEPDLTRQLDTELPYTGAEVVWATRNEMARTLDDVLARRLRALPLNARAAMRMAPETAKLLARETGKDEAWAKEQVRAFQTLAAQYALDSLGDTTVARLGI